MVGAEPSFGRVHVVRALLALSGGPVGRKKLVGLLGVGEGSVRTILKKLSAERLIESAKAGHSLSAKGERKVRGILGRISTPVKVELAELSGSGGQSAVVVYGASGRIESAVSLRDTALRAGADGALILVCGVGGLSYPRGGMGSGAPDIEGLEFTEGDVVVVGFAATQEKAEDGALAVALELSE